MSCDVCGRVGETKPVNGLLGLASKVEVICPRCEKIAYKMLDRFRHMAWVRTGRKLLAMKKRNTKRNT